MCHAGFDAVFLEMAFFNPDDALPADLLLAAQGLDVDTKQPRSLNQVNPFGNLPPPAGRLKDDHYLIISFANVLLVIEISDTAVRPLTGAQ